ncbi:MAG TPA: hypothetical protein ENH82_16615 [bacterium]|nr:hypothetical protein [bacterium]
MKITAKTLKKAGLEVARIEDLADGDVFYYARTLENWGDDSELIKVKQGKLVNFANGNRTCFQETVKHCLGEDIYIPVKQA